MASNVWISDRRLYLNAAGQVVEAGAPDRVSLLVAAGGRLPLADAERLRFSDELTAEALASVPDELHAAVHAVAEECDHLW